MVTDIRTAEIRFLIFRCKGNSRMQSGLKQLLDSLLLKSHVIFYSNKSGKELDELYDGSDIALGSFGMYKLGLYTLGALKTREYLAKL